PERLHEPVLDPVVDHLHVVAGAGSAEAQPAARADRRTTLLVRLRCEHVEDRRQRLDRLPWSADHHAVPDLQAPYAAGDADIDVGDPALAQRLRAALVVGPARVAAVDDRVA